MRRSEPPSNMFACTHRNPQDLNPSSISIVLAVFTQLTAQCPYTLQITMGHPFPIQIARPMGDLDTQLIRDSFGSSEPKTKKCISIGSAVFFTAHRRVSLYCTMGCPPPPKNCPFPWEDLDAHLIHGFLGQLSPQPKTAPRSAEPFLKGSPL